MPLGNNSVDIEECLVAREKYNNNAKAMLLKIHKQFAHPTQPKMTNLPRDANMWKVEYESIMNDMYERCETCRRFQRTPSKPVVCVPLASRFNESVAMDLKVLSHGSYILYLIDMFTRFTKAVFLNNKRPPTIIEKVMLMWVGSGLGSPKKFLADNGGEFSNEEYRDMCENLNVGVLCTAAESPWQNGICERNHAVVDRCLSKILEDDPKMNINTALAWAINAKNSLQMWNEFSSYQLVFGQNHNIPNTMCDKPPALEGKTTSATFAEHINALHSARRAYISAENSERVRRALRYKLRSYSEHFEPGYKVY